MKTLMRLSEDGLVKRNCHDMPAVIPKMLNLLKMEITSTGFFRHLPLVQFELRLEYLYREHKKNEPQ